MSHEHNASNCADCARERREAIDASIGRDKSMDGWGLMHKAKRNVPPCGPSYKGICCEHVESTETGIRETATKYVCCNCGADRTVRVLHDLRAKWTSDAREHGPYEPKTVAIL